MTTDDRLGLASGSSAWRLGLIPPVAAFALFAVMAFLYLAGEVGAYAAILHRLGIDPYRFPFLDTHAVLSAIECHRRGIDVFVQNPCDALGRPLVYSPFWLLGSAMPGLDTGVNNAAGLTLDLAFFASLFWLPPPRRLADALLLTLVTLSTMTVFALERANNDLVIFVLAIIVARLALRGAPVRFFAYAAALFAAMLKFYPIALLALALRERWQVFVAVTCAALAATVSFVVFYAADLVRVLPLIPTGSYFTGFFGARNLPFGLVQLATGGGASAAAVARAMEFLLAGSALLVAIRISAGRAVATAFSRLGEDEAVFLLTGALLILGCFFTGQSIEYRGIHFLLVLPGLLVLRRQSDGTEGRRFAVASGLVAFIMWGECLQRGVDDLLTALALPPFAAFGLRFAFWFGREAAWWWVVTVLAGILFCFCRQSEAARLAQRLVFGGARALRQ